MHSTNQITKNRKGRRVSRRLSANYVNVNLLSPKPISFHLYSTLLYSTLLYSTLLYSTLLYSTLLYSTLIVISLKSSLNYYVLSTTLFNVFIGGWFGVFLCYDNGLSLAREARGLYVRLDVLTTDQTENFFKNRLKCHCYVCVCQS